MKKNQIQYHDRWLFWLSALAAGFMANSFPFWAGLSHPFAWGLAALAVCNLLPLVSIRNFPNFKMRICNHGVLCLRVFRVVGIVSLVYHLATFRFVPFLVIEWVWSLLFSMFVMGSLYWNGMICVYATAKQLGLGLRATGFLLRRIPLAQMLTVGTIIRTVTEEINFEVDKHKLNRSRKKQAVCRTRYPLLLVHGVFFRDDPGSTYWGRIPDELRRNGATIYFGNHQSADSVAGSGRELSRRIRELCRSTGCEKVNIIAHSKGGLDCRAAIADPETAKMVGSLTTINTPHRGCQFADYLLTRISGEAQQLIATTYNAASKKRGDFDPDFLGAVHNLTAGFCCCFDADTPTPEGVYCQSVGSRLNKVIDGPFPLNFSAQLIKQFDGDNDGLVGESAFAWGDNYIFITADSGRGISHGDVVDQTQENIPGFDVREFYVQLVADLKKRGL